MTNVSEKLTQISKLTHLNHSIPIPNLAGGQDDQDGDAALEAAERSAGQDGAGTNCIKIGLPGKLILSLRESIFREDLALYNYLQATALNKRLKDIMDKQKANSKFGKAGGAGNTGAGGLAGAGERLRNWINEEMDVIVTVKEATATR